MRSPKQLTYLVFITAVVALAALLYFEKSLLLKNLSRLEADLDKLRLKNQADSFFIAGHYHEALTLYNQLDSLTGDSLHRIRQGQIPGNDSTAIHQQLIEVTARLKQTWTLLDQIRKNQSASTPDTVVLTTHDAQQEEEITLLREKLTNAQKEINRLKNNRGVIRFTTARNGKVTYFGDLENNMANGIGFGYWTSGSTYEGEWKNNKRHGKGVFQWADGEKYDGQYRDDLRHGYGVYTSKSGRYEGFWENDMRHGEGKLYEPNGKLKVHGVWNNDKLVKTIK
ncbi:MAG: hypothetical protein NZM13_05035 [Cyclobacteriaceae bacterium]|nr:hypothetical protein [Cyclobacteriaceae bacterium]MDW8331074.1 hypothetical protein [Cyclobacteriaceae bacterium]